MLNLLKIVCTFCTKIFDLVNNDVQNGENQPHQEFGDGHMCLNIKYLKNWMHSSYSVFENFRVYVHVP